MFREKHVKNLVKQINLDHFPKEKHQAQFSSKNVILSEKEAICSLEKLANLFEKNRLTYMFCANT